MNYKKIASLDFILLLTCFFIGGIFALLFSKKQPPSKVQACSKAILSETDLYETNLSESNSEKNWLPSIPSLNSFKERSSKERNRQSEADYLNILSHNILSHIVDLNQQTLRFYWQGEDNKPLLSFGNLKRHLKNKGENLVFATNGGMFLEDYSPQGLYIENDSLLKTIDRSKKGYGNFYMKPNGLFCILEKENKQSAVICKTEDFDKIKNDKSKKIKYATQSGPMLLIDGTMHPKFRKGSENVHIRNAVGILPDGRLLFAMSKETINFYDLAQYFKSQGCKNALYLDGYVSRTYLPSKNSFPKDRKFGVMIGETKPL